MLTVKPLFALALLLAAGGCSKKTPDSVTPSDPGGLKTSIAVFAGSESERGDNDNDDPLKARFDHPRSTALDGTTLWVADGYDETSLRRIDLNTGHVSTAIQWNNFDGSTGIRRSINDLEVNPVTHRVWMVTKEGELWEYNPVTAERNLIIKGEDPQGVIKDEYDAVQVGNLAQASMAEAYGLAISPNGQLIYVSDNVRGVIKQVNLHNSGNEVTVYAGKPYSIAHNVSEYAFADGPRQSATFSAVQDLSFTKDNKLLVADNGWSCLRTVDADGVVSLTNHNPGVSSTGLNRDGAISQAVLNRPAHVAVSGSGIFFIDYAGLRLLRPGKDVSTLHPDFSIVHRSGALPESISATNDGKTIFEAQGNAIYKYSIQ